MQLFQRGVDLLLNVQDAMTNVGTLSRQDVYDLLRETEEVLRHLLSSDNPVEEIE